MDVGVNRKYLVELDEELSDFRRSVNEYADNLRLGVVAVRLDVESKVIAVCNVLESHRPRAHFSVIGYDGCSRNNGVSDSVEVNELVYKIVCKRRDSGAVDPRQDFVNVFDGNCLGCGAERSAVNSRDELYDVVVIGVIDSVRTDLKRSAVNRVIDEEIGHEVNRHSLCGPCGRVEDLFVIGDEVDIEVAVCVNVEVVELVLYDAVLLLISGQDEARNVASVGSGYDYRVARNGSGYAGAAVGIERAVNHDDLAVADQVPVDPVTVKIKYRALVEDEVAPDVLEEHDGNAIAGARNIGDHVTGKVDLVPRAVGLIIDDDRLIVGTVVDLKSDGPVQPYDRTVSVRPALINVSAERIRDGELVEEGVDIVFRRVLDGERCDRLVGYLGVVEHVSESFVRLIEIIGKSLASGDIHVATEYRVVVKHICRVVYRLGGDGFVVGDILDDFLGKFHDVSKIYIVEIIERCVSEGDHSREIQLECSLGECDVNIDHPVMGDDIAVFSCLDGIVAKSLEIVGALSEIFDGHVKRGLNALVVR